VKNTGAAAVKTVQVTARFFDGSQKLIGVASGLALVGTIPAGGDSPFDILYVSPPPGLATFTLAVTAWTTPAPGGPPSTLSATISSTSVSVSGTLHAIGAVENESSETWAAIRVVVAIYDDDGRVLRAGSAGTSPTDLVAGQSGSFDVLIANAPEFETSRAWVDAVRP
jgi:hypothetical protein